MQADCPLCQRSAALCLCAITPRLALRTKVTLIIHHRELARASNTGLLAARSLVNTDVRVRGEGRDPLDLSDLLSREYRSYVLFPASGAVLLTPESIDPGQGPIQLIVPDGTWRQARKLHTRHPELSALPRLKLGAPAQKTFQLRAQSRDEGMATLQAVAEALGIIEGAGVRQALMRLYQAKIQRTLERRGMTAEERARLFAKARP